MTVNAVKCNRCKQLHEEENVSLIRFKTSFNEMICKDCLKEMLDRKTITKVKDKDMYQYDFEKILMKTFENERIIERSKKEIEYREKKNERLLKIVRTIRPDISF